MTNGDKGGKAVVTYDDTTGVPKMSAAIKAAVADWNASGAPVVLEPAAQNASLTFTAASDQPALPPCTSSAPRTVTVTWNKSFWSGTAGKHDVLYPTSDAEHAIGHALGLFPGGRCPALMALKPCPNRATAPSAAQITLLDTLYSAPAGASAPASASPTPSG